MIFAYSELEDDFYCTVGLHQLIESLSIAVTILLPKFKI